MKIFSNYPRNNRVDKTRSLAVTQKEFLQISGSEYTEVYWNHTHRCSEMVDLKSRKSEGQVYSHSALDDLVNGVLFLTPRLSSLVLILIW